MFSLWAVFLFGFITSSKTVFTTENNVVDEVVFVNVLHRHGDRTPGYFYPKDPYQDKSYWPEGVGQLTNRGKKQTFELGQCLRQRYNTLLTDRYNPDIVYVRSTDYDRALMSAECVLAGMFPPRGAQVWSDDLPWQPIPVHTTPLEMDRVLVDVTPCPAFTEELTRVLYSDDKVIKKLNNTYSELLRWISESSGENFTLYTVYKMYDTLLVESLNNMTLPEWTKSVFPEPMRQATVYNYMLIVWNTKLIRLQTGFLLQDMIRNMVEKVENKTTRNVHVYSAHDKMIRNLLTALGAYNYILPPYASCLIMELRIDAKANYYVSLYYRNSTTDGPYLMQVAGCAPVCPLDQFISISQPFIPDDWDRECGITDDNQGSYGTAVGAQVSSLILAILMTMSGKLLLEKDQTTY